MSQAVLAMFWVAEYKDGMALPQYDPDTGAEHLFKDIDFPRLCRFGWYPFSERLNKLVPYSICLPCTSLIVTLHDGDELIAHRSVALNFKAQTNTILNHIADEYAVGIKDKYKLTLNVLKNQVRCE